jgi:excisionase family DNA binding protein
MYMTSKDVQAYLKVSHQTLLKLRARGLPFIKLEKKVLFRQEDIDRFMEAHLVGAIRLPPGPRKPKKKGRREGR